MIDVFKAASLGGLWRVWGGQSAGAVYTAPIGFETDSDAAIVISLGPTPGAGLMSLAAPRAPARYSARSMATKIGRISVASDLCRSRHPGPWLIAMQCVLLSRGLHHEMLAQGVSSGALAWPEQEKTVISAVKQLLINSRKQKLEGYSHQVLRVGLATANERIG
jgi:hypothetical protein